MSEDQKYRDMLQSFDDWDAGLPQDGWGKLESDIRFEQQWNKLDQALNEAKEMKMVEDSYNEWNAGNHLDGWSRIEEELSRERVWDKLNASLNEIPHATPWLKYIASCAAALLIAFYLPVERLTLDRSQIDGEISNENEQLVNSNDHNTTLHAFPANEVVIPDFVKVQKLQVTNQETQTESERMNGWLALNNVVIDEAFKSVENNLDLDEMNPKHLPEFGLTLPADRDPLIFPVMKPAAYHVRVGTQLALLNEKEGSPFNNFFPRAAWTFDLGYTKRIRGVELGGALGVTQFAQESGKYINGRYFNSSQKLNTFQVSATIGKDLGRWTVYGGIQMNKLLFGIEERSNMVTNIYNSDQWNLGATAGVDILMNQFENGDHFDLGVQYQYIPHMRSSNAVFNDVQGLKFQLKFAF